MDGAIDLPATMICSACDKSGSWDVIIVESDDVIGLRSAAIIEFWDDVKADVIIWSAA